MPRFHAPVFFVLVALSALTSVSCFADIRLPKIFSDHMVIQRNQTIRVWGWAESNEELKISIGDSEKTCQANQDGKWQVALPAMKAGGPYELKIDGSEASVLISNVYIGEIWLCAGESEIKSTIEQNLVVETDEEKQKQLALFNNDRIRYFSIGQSALDTIPEDLSEPTSWAKCTPETVGTFSAMSYHFGNHLIQQLDLLEKYKDEKLVIGLIEAGWEETACEAWVSHEALANNEVLNPLLENWNNDEPLRQKKPGAVFNGMIGPILDFNICGVIWFQGESNIGRGDQYRTLMPTLISDWRKRFGIESLPFYFVQLPPKRYEGQDPGALAEIWDAQLKTMSLCENVGMIVSSDLVKDDEEKRLNYDEVGRRLSLWALAKNYGKEDLIFSGPIFENSNREDDGLIVKFTNVGKGLAADDELLGFQVCGEDKVFKTATATIVDSNTVLVRSPEVSNPKQVRFAWTDSAKPNLKNSAGLPASPFRSDDFELLSSGKNH